MNASELSVSVFLTLGFAACGFTNLPNSPTTQNNDGSTITNNPTQNPPVTAATPTPSGSPTTPATFSEVNQQILQPLCAGCHSSGTAPDLSSYGAFALDTAYIVPGNPTQSALYNAVSSGSMPRGGQSLSQAQLTLVYAWIAEGALND